MDQDLLKMETEKEKPLSEKIRNRLKKMHEKSLKGEYISWGDFKRIEDEIAQAVEKLKRELTEWQCDKRFKLPINYNDIVDEIFGDFTGENNNPKHFKSEPCSSLTKGLGEGHADNHVWQDEDTSGSDTIQDVCKCGHAIDEHLEQVGGKVIAGECFKCDCKKFEPKGENKEVKENDTR